MAGIAAFIAGALARGIVTVLPAGPGDEPAAAIAAAIAELDRAARLEAPLAAPPLLPAAAERGARIAYHAARYLALRHLPAEGIAADCDDAGLDAGDPATIWSMDLALRLLPELHRHAVHLAAEDPLTRRLLALGRRWPLSSVGTPGTAEADPAAILAHPCLSRIYADRVAARADVSRAKHPRVRALLAADAGVHPRLMPTAIADLLERA